MAEKIRQLPLPWRVDVCSRIVAGLDREQWLALCEDSRGRGNGKTTEQYIVSECFLLADEIIMQNHKTEQDAVKNNQYDY